MKRREFISLIGGAAAAWPLAARAQRPAMPVIGFMSARSPEDSVYVVAAFRQGLGETGFVEGQNVAIEFRWARGQYDLLPAQYDLLPAMAADLVSHRVAVLAGLGGDPSAIAAKQATSTIPIVFGIGSDPIKAGLVASFNRPGGNVTGYTLLTNEMEPKRLGLMNELVPGVPLIGILANPSFPPATLQLQELEQAAGTIGRRLFVSKANNDVELDSAFALFVQQRVGALLVAGAPYFDTRRDRIIAFAAENRLPAMYHFRDYAVAGGLISYGPSIAEGYRQAGIYVVGAILKGAKPADLPVVQPTKFELVINLKTAKALGFEVPSGLSARADEVIE